MLKFIVLLIILNLINISYTQFYQKQRKQIQINKNDTYLNDKNLLLKLTNEDNCDYFISKLCTKLALKEVAECTTNKFKFQPFSIELNYLNILNNNLNYQNISWFEFEIDSTKCENLLIHLALSHPNLLLNQISSLNINIISASDKFDLNTNNENYDFILSINETKFDLNTTIFYVIINNDLDTQIEFELKSLVQNESKFYYDELRNGLYAVKLRDLPSQAENVLEISINHRFKRIILVKSSVGLNENTVVLNSRQNSSILQTAPNFSISFFNSIFIVITLCIILIVFGLAICVCGLSYCFVRRFRKNKTKQNSELKINNDSPLIDDRATSSQLSSLSASSSVTSDSDKNTRKNSASPSTTATTVGLSQSSLLLNINELPRKNEHPMYITNKDLVKDWYFSQSKANTNDFLHNDYLKQMQKEKAMNSYMYEKYGCYSLSNRTYSKVLVDSLSSSSQSSTSNSPTVYPNLSLSAADSQVSSV